MYFTSIIRFSPEHGRELPFYKIKESFRDVIGRVHTRVMLTPGYLPELCSDEIVQIRCGLTYLMEQSAFIPSQQNMFDTDPRQDYSQKVRGYIEKFWTQIKDSGKIDSARTGKRRQFRLVYGVNLNWIFQMLLYLNIRYFLQNNFMLKDKFVGLYRLKNQFFA